MVLYFIYFLVAALAAIDLLAVAAARKEAKRLAAVLYDLPDPERLSSFVPGQYPGALWDYISRSGILEQAPGHTLRMRWKGSIRQNPRSRRQPSEGKFFMSANTPALVEYADVTTGLLSSRSILRALSPEGARWSEKRWGFRLRPFFSDPEDIRRYLLFEYFAAGVWCPFIWLQPSLHWESDSNGNFFARPEPFLSLTLLFGSDGLPQSFSGDLGDCTVTYTYSGYQPLQGMLIPLRWKVEISRFGTRYIYFEGRVTDMVTKGNFAWW